MNDPMSKLSASIDHEMLHGDDEKLNALYRAMGCSEGEIASYQQTRSIMRQTAKAYEEFYRRQYGDFPLPPQGGGESRGVMKKFQMRLRIDIRPDCDFDESPVSFVLGENETYSGARLGAMVAYSLIALEAFLGGSTHGFLDELEEIWVDNGNSLDELRYARPQEAAKAGE